MRQAKTDALFKAVTPKNDIQFKREKKNYSICETSNKVLGITNDFIYPSNGKIREKEPRYNKTLFIVNKFFQSLGPSVKSRFHCILITTVTKL